jgi:hypothetical protein
MNGEILTVELLMKRRIAQKEGILSGIYPGSIRKEDIYGADSAEAVRMANGQKMESVVVPTSERWVNSKKYTELWGRIEAIIRKGRRANISQFPIADYYTMVDMLRMDITRRRMEYVDFTGEITQEITNAAFGRSICLDEFLPYAGAFEEIKGTGDTVGMIEQRTGETGTVTMRIFGLGWTRSLEDELYNLDIFSLEKVNAAVARGHVARRNDLALGGIIALSGPPSLWTPAQSVAAQSGGATSTYDQNLYLTLKEALRKLYALRDPQTGQEISAPRVVLLIGNNVTEWDVSRVIRGQLNKPNSEISNLEGLPIDQVWKYKGDAFTVGPKTYRYPGVPANVAYLLVPGPAVTPASAYTLTKRGLTQEIGRGSVLQLSREERAWYFAQTAYGDEFIGSSLPGTALADGFGYIVEVELPTDAIET